MAKQNVFRIIISICVIYYSSKSYTQHLTHLAPTAVVSSEIMDADYQLFVSLPDSYNETDSITYPVLYFMDGRRVIESFRSAQHLLQIDSVIEDVILVGIGTDIDKAWMLKRWQRYTPTVNAKYDHKLRKVYNLEYNLAVSGQAEKFLTAIELEIIPYVEKTYKTNGLRALSGHSLAGLFVSYVLSSDTELFNMYSITSPVLWWDGKDFLKNSNHENGFELSDSIEKILVCVGGEEDMETIQNTRELFEIINNNNPDRAADIEWVEFKGEGHFSVIPATISRTLKFLYQKNEPIDATSVRK